MALAASSSFVAHAQTPGQNVNMVSGTKWPGGDPFLQRQDEPSIAVSTRNPQHLLAGANDYRTVDLNLVDQLPINQLDADAWNGVFESFDGGQRWQSTLLPGFPQDQSSFGAASPMKGFGAASDPVVRAGTNGMFYYLDIAFNRTTNVGGLFVSRFMDLNNKENGDAAQSNYPGPSTAPIRYINTATVALGNATHFIDKPWLAVDIPRAGAGTCTMRVPEDNGTFVAQTIPAGNVYAAYAVFLGARGLRSKIKFTRSSDCGKTWTDPIKLSHEANDNGDYDDGPDSETDATTKHANQGVQIAIDPETGYIYVSWRVFSLGGSDPDVIVVAKSTNGGKKFSREVHVQSLLPFNLATPTAAAFFDQGTTNTSFRATTFPTLAVDDSGSPGVPGNVYLAWSQRGQGPNGEGRIMLTTSPDGVNWSRPNPVDNGSITDDSRNTFSKGHQFMPSMTFIEGKLMLLYYDQRLDHTTGLFTPNTPFGPDAKGQFFEEDRLYLGDAPSTVFTPYVDDAGLTIRRHTIDVNLAQSNGGLNPSFTYARVSRYDFGLPAPDPGILTKLDQLEQLKVDPPNLPMFAKGTVAFMGDYLDIAGLMFVPLPGGGWTYNNPVPPNVSPSRAAPKPAAGSPTHYVSWTSNQDVIPPANGDWTTFFPITSGTSIFNGTPTSACVAGFEGDRNQNIYESRITQGLLVSSPQNSKPLSTTLQRAFVILAQNSTNFQKYFELSIANQPPGNFSITGQSAKGGFASFQQAVPNQPSLPNPLPAPVTIEFAAIPAHSGATRTVFALSSNPTASITIDLNEVDTNGNVISGGLSSIIVLNADGTVPPLVNPDAAPAGTNIAGVEIYDPNITAPNITAPNITAPNITAPNITAPNITAPNITAPNITAPNITAPNITATTVTNPNITAPNITAGSISDATYTATNNGNTTAAYRVKLVGGASGANANVPLQLTVTQVYATPTSVNCQLIPQQQNITYVNVITPEFTPLNQLSNPNITAPNITAADPSEATVYLKPGDSALITLRGQTNVTTMASIVTQIGVVFVQQAVDTSSTATTPTIAAQPFITTATLPGRVTGASYTATVQAIGGIGSYTWGISAGSLPGGLSINPSTGVISGTLSAFAGTFTFTVQVTDSATPTPNTATRQLSITVAPQPPTSIVAGSVSSSSVTLTWNASPSSGLNGYNVYRATTPGAYTTKLNSAIVGGTNFTDTTVVGGNTYYYVVRAVGPGNVESANSNEVRVVVPNLPVLSGLTFFVQPTNTAEGVVISPPVQVLAVDSSESPVQGVSISMTISSNPGGGTLSGHTTVITGVTGIAVFSDLSIDKAGSGYTLVASALSSAVQRVSAGFSITPAPPTLVSSSVTSSTASLSWSASTTSNVTGYNVYRALSASGPFTTPLPTATNLSVTNFTDTPVVTSTTYYYVVTVLAGGFESGFSTPLTANVGFTYEQLLPATPPSSGPGRCCSAMTYDPVSASTLLFGGYQCCYSVMGDTWKFQGGQWTQLLPTNPPPARSGAAMVYYPTANKIVLFGGYNIGTSTDFNDTWVWDGSNSTWTKISPTVSPSGATLVGRRFDSQGMAYDPNTGTIVMFGGIASNNTTFFNDTWTLSFSSSNNTWTWTQMTPTSIPSARRTVLATDPAGNVMLFGGLGPTGNLGDTWVWNGANWEQQFPATSPSARDLHNMTFDPGLGVVVLFAGANLSDTWTWDGANWTQVLPPAAPPNRYAFGMDYDSAERAIVIFGGFGNPIAQYDTWILSLVPPPTNLTPSSNGPNIVLNWTASASSGVAGYNVYRATTSGAYTTPLNSAIVATPTYTDTSVVGGITYYYVVRAVGPGNVESPNSNEVTVPVPNPPPNSPTNLAAGPVTSSSVTLTWTASTSGGVVGYNVYRATTSGGYTTPLSLVGSGVTTFADTTVVGGTTYYYVVRAVGPGSVESANSNEVTVVVPSASVLTGLIFSVQPTNTVAGVVISPPVQVQAVAGTAPLPGVAINMAIAIGFNPSGGTLSGTLTQTTGMNGIATFPDLSIDMAGIGYKLAATSATIGTTSNPFSITNSPRQVSVGGDHTCALLSDSTVECWGYDAVTDFTTSTPVAVSGLSGAKAIAAGNDHACALLSSGRVQCWGYNNYGLGDGTTFSSSTPVTVSGLSVAATAIAAAADGSYTCALLADGTVQCWGYNGEGELGNGSTTDSSTPVAVKDSTGESVLSGATAIGAADSHTCALLSGGTVLCWGYNGYGQLGNGTSTSSSIPVPVSGPGGSGVLSGAKAIAVGDLHTCALLSDGTGECWGLNGNGQLGNGIPGGGTFNTPMAVSGLSGATAIVAGFEHTCALLADGTAQCWGYNVYGQRGDGTLNDSNIPLAVSGLSSAAAISAGGSDTCALLSGGTVECWGYNNLDQLGNGTDINSRTPAAVIGLSGLGGATAIAPGDYHTCALLSNGTVKCWGNNFYGQLGNGSTTDSSTPVLVTGLSGAKAIAAGGDDTCALLSGGTVKCWGYNGNGQLGNGTTIDSSIPVPVSGPGGSGVLSGAMTIAAGEYHSCALLSNGTAQCWGYNGKGQLGNGTTIDSSIPVAVTGLSGATAITAGDYLSCALLSDGTAQCWGWNQHGQLGNGNFTDSSTPGLVHNLGGATAITARGYHTCALLPTGTGQCWGYNVYGQLGNGNFTDSSTPVPVTGLSGATAFAAGGGGEHTCALLSTGTAQCWGYNVHGQLGNGSFTNSNTPVPVNGLSGATDFAAGFYHTCALLSGGTGQCWGYNFYGQLGNGTTTDSSTPVAVIGLVP